MRVLAVDSSSVTASVAILEDNEIIAEYFLNVGLTHSQTLALMIESVLKNSKISPSEIDLYASANGPGSFTGIRIGLSTVKAMALANSKPCLGVSSLYTLAYNLKDKNNILCACMDARNSQVYNALFRLENDKIKRITKDRAVNINDLKKELGNFKEKIEIVGDGAEICYNSFKESDENFAKNVLFCSESKYISAANLGFAAAEIYSSEKDKNKINSEINYIRIPQAQRILEENRKL